MPDTSKMTRSIKWKDDSKKTELIFTLNRGDIGKCTTDSDPRHNAPYWERAEVRQEGNLEENKNFVIKFDINLSEGFSSERETFFQIHASNNMCSAAPVLMMKLNYGKLIIELLEGISDDNENGNHRNKYEGNLSIHDFKNYNSFEVLVNQKEKNITIFKDDVMLIENQQYQQKTCSKLYSKFGIYRPGNENTKRSIAIYKNISIRELSN
ncbi:heparin lyase I family protein [Rheinheimera sp.]|uniref:heparin lyase I family protein n=1 Tax=Rheinheimera sp. TaxID=1869214 RepID=UPI002634C4A3|nr:heparin lyase I family protein [Rheinheimera sp.]MCA1931504.1 polysaccharide lyase [Rheinheimera sp.]